MKHIKQLKFVLAGIVAFTTVLTLIRPAITFENTICGLEEHTHTEECYQTIQNTVPHKTLSCTEESLHIHKHSPNCYDENNNIICGYADYVIHEHNEDCYDENNQLVCTLPEIKEHTHDDNCYDSENNLICDKQEFIEHTHDNNCYDPEGNLICGLPELKKHIHDDSCFTQTEEIIEDEQLICDKPEHIHTENCYPDETDIEQVISMIDSLPESEEIQIELDNKEENVEEYNLYLKDIQNQILNVQDSFNQLTEEQKTKVHNFDSLNNLLWVLEKESILDNQSSYVSELNATDVKVNNQENVYATDNDEIDYEVQISTDSYIEGFYKEGRVKVKVVLPLNSEKIDFDIEKMDWLDTSEGYKPQITEEDNKQILTGYKLIKEENNESAIPSTFSENIILKVNEVEEEQNLTLNIQASNEEKDEGLQVSTKTIYLVEKYTKEQKEQLFQNLLDELKSLSKEQLEEFMKKVQNSYDKGYLTKDSYEDLMNQINDLLNENSEIIAEPAIGTNWMSLRDSGYFEEYNQYTTYAQRKSVRSAVISTYNLNEETTQTTSDPSDVQVVNQGGSKTSDDNSVTVSKTIDGTDLENVFDITLQVQTSTKIEEITQEPDMAIVIVMDISNTMNSNFGGVTRYAAAMTAAENFLNQFYQNNTLGISKIGYVAFNTDAHQIFGLQSCTTQEQANNLKNTMRTQTGKIINDLEYDASHSRFTNVQAGLAMASDMLNGVSNKNKYIIFLSDGFPTTYISSGYSGYDPYDETGTHFYDKVLNKKCKYGTSYSDKAAKFAKEKASEIKDSGTKIFSIGVDVGGQTIQQYIKQSEAANGFSVVDRTGTTYEIGDASSTEAYKNWLRNSIGSGYYYDSTDSAGLSNAYNQIFAEIKQQTEQATIADWVANDPIPSKVPQYVEFIGFYNKSSTLIQENSLTGSHVLNGENTSSYSENKINWDLKKSGYTTSQTNNATWYTYSLKYRVRLKNEEANFSENSSYNTNDTTTLKYKNVLSNNGNLTMSSDQTIEFPIPSVKGYLCELEFKKVDATTAEHPLSGAEFTLEHDNVKCNKCKGNGNSVKITAQTAISDNNGNVSFTNIPSGHKYILKETKAPNGYSITEDTYNVDVSYNDITVNSSSENKTWNRKVVNAEYHELPETGGPGDWLYIGSGIGLIMIAGYFLIKRRIHWKEDINSR